MSAKRIIFRADGSHETGLGHLYRLFALAEIYKEHREFIFLTRKSTTQGIIPPQYQCDNIPAGISTESEPQWIYENYSPDEFILIADGYQFDADYQKAIKALNYKLLYVDDPATSYMHADVVINHSLAVTASAYQAAPYTRFALGTKYAILRPEFLEAAKHDRRISKIDRVFVCFGGADPSNLTCMAVKALLNVPEISEIEVVIGGAFRHAEIFELEKKHGQVTVHRNLPGDQLIKVMQACNMGIAPASTILYELCAVKMPLLSGYYVENQKNIYQGCIANGLVYGGGNFSAYGIADFEKAITALIRENDHQKYPDAQAKMFDGAIKARFLDLLKEFNYRKATAEDLMLVFGWANDPVSRANSYASNPINLEAHKNWFEKKLRDPRATIYIAASDGQPAGMIRYESGEQHTVVGILVDAGHRGKGLAASFLKDTAALYFSGNDLPVLAYIKKSNLASVRSFEKAGYKKLKEEVVQGHDSFVYKLEKHDV